ncbi:MAG: hypothetical protein KDA89_01605 [Planctomycetaceae bacterium]|nr:hypothetical protein [Planctomycetaceae bacterium]
MEIKIIIFLVIMFFSMIQSLTKSGRERRERQQLEEQRRKAMAGGDADRRRRVQSEIESFLSEVTGRPVAVNADQRQAEEERRRREEAQKNREQALRRRKQQQKQRPQAGKSAPAARQQRLTAEGMTDSSTRPDRELLGDHVSSYMKNNVAEFVDETIVQNVDSHLGKRDLEMPGDTSASSGESMSPAAAAVRQLLQSPEGVRNAILVNEILSRPRVLRRSESNVRHG